MNDIEQLLAETEQDANEVSTIAIRLVNKFGMSPVLAEFVAEANRVRDRVNRQRLQYQRLNQQPISADRGVRLQILRAEVNQTRIEMSRKRSLLEELDQND
jgi:hypothetical protein